MAPGTYLVAVVKLSSKDEVSRFASSSKGIRRYLTECQEPFDELRADGHFHVPFEAVVLPQESCD